MEIIKAENIRKSFGTLEVLKGVDICVEKGEVVSIMGASGAGKTTFLQVLGTLSAPDSGYLAIEGTPISTLRGDALADFRCRHIGFVFQSHHLLPEFSALENVMIPYLIGGGNVKQARSRARELLSEVGLENRHAHKPSQLSGGEQQRVAIARALVNNPSVIFADEPSGNLDSVTKEQIHSLFFDLRERFSQTFVIVTHDPQLGRMCDRCIRMKDGLISNPE